MSEAMTVESIIEAEWILKGFWSKTRFPYQTKNNAWSDIDVVAYHPETKHLVISESKVQGTKHDLFAYFSVTKEEYEGNAMEFMPNYFSFIKNLDIILKEGIIFSNTTKMVKKLTVQLVSNFIIESDLLNESKKQVKREIKKAKCIPKNCKIFIRLDTTIDIFARVITDEAKSTQGRRYGNPILDMARELNRYVDPKIHYVGGKKSNRELVKAQATKALLNALRTS